MYAKKKPNSQKLSEVTVGIESLYGPKLKMTGARPYVSQTPVYAVIGILPESQTRPHTVPLLTQIPARRIQCCGCNMQIHMDYRNPVEEKGLRGHSL